jgi:Dimethlysulfonioproprionate lyase
MAHDFFDLLAGLAGVFAVENRDGGSCAADALGAAVAARPATAASASLESTAFCRRVLAKFAPEDLADLAGILPRLNWDFAGLDNGRIRPEIARRMLTAELLGPDGAVFHPDLRVGLFLQDSHLDYVTRSHPAEECFHMLAGEGFWSVDDGPAHRRVAGQAVFHPSHIPHASLTRDRPLLAAWRWSGDIGWEGYSLRNA